MEAVALHSFSPNARDELSFEQEDMIKILNIDNPNWYYGELNGVCGLVPENYVSFPLPLWFMNVTKADAITLLRKRNGSQFQHPEGAFLVRPSESCRNDLSISTRIRDVQHFKILRNPGKSEYFLWKAGPYFPSITTLIAHYRRTSVSNKEVSTLKDLRLNKVVASYDFDARSDTELTIRQNEVITVLSDEDPDWLMGQVERDQKTFRGLLPANYASRQAD